MAGTSAARRRERTDGGGLTGAAGREGAEHKAFGAGILSSIDELEHFGAGRAEFAPFDPSCPQPKMSYKDGVQQRYFVLDGFREGTRQLRAYAAAHGGAGPPPSLAR